jgi:hypothetical protein
VTGGGGDRNTGARGEPPAGAPQKLALVHGRAFLGGQPELIGVTPSLQAGNVGVCVRVPGEASCNGPFPTAAYPIYGGGEAFRPEEKVGPAGEIDAIFTGPGVAAMRVAHLGTFKAEPAAGLPGAKQIVFYRAPGSRGSVLAPGLSPRILEGFERARRGPALTETLLDRSGRPIPVGKAPSMFALPNSYWQAGQAPPAGGRCAISSSLPGVRTEWGQVARRIAADPDASTPAWLTCLHTWLSLADASYETAVLLNAQAPGRPPAPLWGATPLPGHPGIVQVPAEQREVHFRIPRRSEAQVARELARDTKQVGRTRAVEDVRPAEQLSGSAGYRDVLIPPTLARRDGAAWVLVRGGGSLAGRIALLRALHLTKLQLGSPLAQRTSSARSRASPQGARRSSSQPPPSRS